ncbi:MAG: WYL domain-containing protein [Acidimicrobiales bacterium]
MTTTTVAPPSAWDTLQAALRQRRPVQLSYHGRPRTVCPHALGWKNNKPMLLAYQTDGHTSTQDLPADPRKQWRNLFVDEIRDAVFADPPPPGRPPITTTPPTPSTPSTTSPSPSPSHPTQPSR